MEGDCLTFIGNKFQLLEAVFAKAQSPYVVLHTVVSSINRSVEDLRRESVPFAQNISHKFWGAAP